MPIVGSTVQINRRPEEVWAYLTDFSRHAEWSPKPWKMESLTEGPVRVGSKFRSTGWVPRDANHVNDRTNSDSRPKTAEPASTGRWTCPSPPERSASCSP